MRKCRGDKSNCRTQLLVFLLKHPADVVDGEVLLAQLEDLLACRVALGRGVRPLHHRQKESAMRVLTKVVTHYTKASSGIAESFRGLSGGDTLDEVGTEGFVAAMGGIGRFEEDLLDVAIGYLFTRLRRHTATMSH